MFAQKHSYTELGTGLCHKDTNGNWVDSKDVIESYSKGAIASQGPYQAIFASDLNSNGAIDQQTPDGKRLRSNILGLAYYDTASGQSVVIAEVQDSQGELISANQVLYPNAFTGVQADVRYTYKKSSFEQDVILREQPPTPESFGLNSATTEIEVLTEFLNPPQAVVTEHRTRNNPLPDDDVVWGAMRLGHGRAIELGEPTNKPSKVPVRRQYGMIGGRQILIEGVRIDAIASHLAALPLQSSIRTKSPVLASKSLVLPKTPGGQSRLQPMKLASASLSPRGYVLDYLELNTDLSDFTFQSDTTYLLDNYINLGGTTTFEGGTVIKNDGFGGIYISGTIVCKTGGYKPAVFTSINDDSLGEAIDYADPYFTGSPSYTDVGIFLETATNAVLSNMRFDYCSACIYNDANIDLWDCQFNQVDQALFNRSEGVNVNLYNVLINEAADDNAIILGGDGNLTCENMTCDGSNGIPALLQTWPGTSVNLTNCLITQIDPDDGLYEVSTDGTNYTESASPTYQTVGGGNYYLATGSPYHNAGTTQIDPALLADLAGKTTYPPVVYGYQSITIPTTLGPQAQRDNVGNPDLGYHYDALDYLFGACDLYTNLTFTNGVAVGWFEDTGGIYSYGQPYGISLNDWSSFTTTGTATAPCWFTRYNTVQDGAVASRGWLGGLLVNGSGAVPIPQVTAQFTKISTEPNMGTFIRDNWAYGQAAFSDCELYAGFPSYRPSMFFTNCLFFRCGITFDPAYQDSSFAFQNCTWWQGSFNPNRYGAGSSHWTILNTTFDGTGISTYDARGGSAGYTTFNYNAFLSGSNLLETVGSHDLTNNTSFNWESSWLGNFYLPANSPLIQAGSTNANLLGLYPFTTQTNQVPETNSIVAIGYHYEALVPPLITQQPTNQTVMDGGNGSFDISVAGVGPYSIYWLCNGSSIFSNLITTVAGNQVPGFSGDGGVATNAELGNPCGVAVDKLGNMYVADYNNAVIRKVDTNGVISTVAGNVSHGYAGDGGLATNATLGSPTGVAVDQVGNLYIADTYNNVVREVTTNGIITTVAGTNSLAADYSGDGGKAVAATLNNPMGVAVDSFGNLYIADYNNNVVRKVNTNGIITTVAGNVSLGGRFYGDGGAATNAGLWDPAAVTVDSSGRLYIADEGNCAIRLVNTNGSITTVAGNGSYGYAGDGGAATNALLNDPLGVAVDAWGDIYIADTFNNVMREVDANGNISTVAGDHSLAGTYSGDGGPATGAGLNFPAGTAVDGTGNLYIADKLNEVIRKVYFLNYRQTNQTATLAIPEAQPYMSGNYQVIISNDYGSTTSSIAALLVYVKPAITANPASESVTLDDDAVFAVTATGIPSPAYQWYFNGTNLLAGATNSELTVCGVQSNNIGNYSVVVTNVGGSVTSSPAALTISGTPSYMTPVGSLSNYTFQADSTYYIGATVTLVGTNTIEGGTVIKFSTNGSLVVAGQLVLKTGPYRPAYLTSRNDNSAGLMFDQSTGVPQMATNGLAYINFAGWNFVSTGGVMSAVATVKYLRFAYADKALAASYALPYGSSPTNYAGQLHVWDCQFVDCNWALANWFDGLATFDLHNDLFAGCQYTLAGAGSGGEGAFLVGEQLTSDTTTFCESNSLLTSVALTNSIVLGNFQFASTTMVATNSVLVDPPAWTVFQNAGGGNYYLASATEAIAGSSGISAAMRAELAIKTTYPPVLYPPNTNLSGSLELDHQAGRDTNSLPAIGYHYDPLDYVLGSADLEEGSLVISPGTAVGVFGTTNYVYGLDVGYDADLTANGCANKLAEIAAYNTVQEEIVPGWITISNASVVCDAGNDTNMVCDFVDWSGLAQDTVHLQVVDGASPAVIVNDCQFHGGKLVSGADTVNFTNNLFERVNSDIEPNDANVPCVVNNLFYYGTFSFYPAQTNAVIKNNLFDHSTIPNRIGGVGNIYNGGYNAYVTNCSRLQPVFANDVVLSNSLAYQSGPFGSYYQPNNSVLIKKGSATANLLGLYHFTTQTNELPETNAVVDIGYHYVATDANGNPLDSNRDGVPDYIEDVNGNGLDDTGETPWDIAILTQPISEAVNAGSMATLTVTAGGNLPISYQWKFKGTNISGATLSTYAITNTSVSNIGNYCATVTGATACTLTSSNASLYVNSLLGRWRFDNTNTWVGDEGQLPLADTNLIGVPSWNTNAVLIDSTNQSFLRYNLVETNGDNNLDLAVGTVRFWFKPDWTSGSGPGENGRLMEIGYNPSSPFNDVLIDFTNGWWALIFNTNGTQLSFASAFNGVGGVNVSAPVVLISNQWNQVVLTYTATNSLLYFNGELAASGFGATNNPGPADITNGFSFGADAAGINQSRGTLDMLETFNYPIDPGTIQSNYLSTLTGPPAIAIQPSSQTVPQGRNATFNVTAIGGNLNYHWQFNNTNLTVGAASSVLTLTNVVATNAGNYSVIITNVDGSVTSSNASLTVITPPVITSQPTNLAVLPGSNATFTVSATGGELSYAWWFNGSPLGGAATNSVLTLTNVSTTNAGNYLVVVTNITGSATSSNALLTVIVPPVITSQPASQIAPQGGNAAFSVTATGGSLNYRWWFNGTNLLTGKTNSFLTLASLSTTNAGNYSVTVTNLAGSVTSSNALLSVVTPPVIMTQPTNLTVLQGSNASFSVTATGGFLSYAWWFNTNNAVAGATNSTLTLTSVTAANAGNYFVAVTNLAGAAASSNALLTVLCPPSITQQPLNQEVVFGQPATFTAVAAGTPALKWQWFSNSVPIIGATTNIFTIPVATSNVIANYLVVITNLYGTATSSIVTVQVDSLLADSDYDGRNNGQELGDGTSPYNPNSVISVQLGNWRFDVTNAVTNTWIGDEGQLPFLATNVTGIPSWDTNAVLIDTTNAAILSYRDVETNGNANINIRCGSISFWFKPDWTSVSQGGNGPGTNDYGRFIEMGRYNPLTPTNSSGINFTNGWWAAYVTPDGNQFIFESSTNGAYQTNLAAPVFFTSNQWCQLVLTYTPTNSLLYYNAQLVMSGLGPVYYPNLTERSAGFRVGSDVNGANQARGAFDDLATFNYPLAPGTITTNYQNAVILDSDGDGLSNLIENELGLNPYGYNSPNGLSTNNALIVFTPLK